MGLSSAVRGAQQQKPPQTLTGNFNPDVLSGDFQWKTLEQRLHWAHEKFGDGLVLTSSFGAQSILLLEALKKSGLDIPVVTVDIPDEKYNAQRRYRDHLHTEMGFRLYVAAAKDESDKTAAMDRLLGSMGATASIAGIRFDQTQNRAQRKFIEINPRNEIVAIHPLLDWPQSKAEFYLEKVTPDRRHPEYAEGFVTTGGAAVAEKEECGLHIFNDQGAHI